MEEETKQKFVISFTLIMLLELTALITIYYGGLLGLIVDEQGILTQSFFVLQFVTQVVLFIFLIIQYLIDELSEKYKKFMNFMEAIICISYLISTYCCILCITKYLLLQLIQLITFTLQQNLLITLLLISFIIQLIIAQTYLLFKHTTISNRFVGTIQLYLSLYIQQFFVIIDVAFLIFYLTFFKALVQFNQIMPVYKSMLIIVSEVQLYIIIMQGLNFKTFIGYGAKQVKYLTLHIKIFEGTMIGFVTYVYIIKQIFGFNVFILFNLILINYTYVRLLLLGKSSPDKNEKIQNLIQISTVECQKCGHQIGINDYIKIWRDNQNITVYHQDCNPSRINGAHSVYDQLQLRTILNQKDNIQSKNQKVKIKFILILYSIICLAILSYIYYSVNYIYVDTPIYQKKTKFYYFYRIYHTKLYLFCTYCALWILTIIYMAFEFSNPGIKMCISIISTMILLYTYGQLMIYMNQNNMRIKFQSQYEYYNGTWFIMASLLSSSLFLKLGFFIDQNIEYLQYCINITVSFFTFSCLVIWFSMPSNSWEYFIKYIYLYFNLYTLIFDMCVLLQPDTQLQISRNKFLQNFYNFNYYLIMMAFVIGYYMMFFFFKVSAEEVSTAQCYYYTMAMITSRFLNIQIQKVNKIQEERRKQQDRNISMNDIKRYIQQQQVEVQNPQKILLQLSG